ncbi:hypothetical protein I7I53_00072 [Histoplasma capsulatum var. duboisii H88]|uniref:Uncharacterized protein n=1 Tax=Ajellomyces capsulatus (strain H88) TaxID=544711 RepID=A0A8A1LLV0_AJEC8|nr:hypothetical protein I7I53_00072 [Histoplasma capsulatum var. duboisii H88]
MLGCNALLFSEMSFSWILRYGSRMCNTFSITCFFFCFFFFLLLWPFEHVAAGATLLSHVFPLIGYDWTAEARHRPPRLILIQNLGLLYLSSEILRS